MNLPAKRSTAVQPITERRKETFLRVLKETGSVCAAARSATPWGRGAKSGYSSFLDLIKRDPEFAAAVAEAKHYALGRVERHMHKLAVEGVKRPIYQGGKLAGFEIVYEPKLLLALLQHLDPEGWMHREKVEVEGKHGVLVVGLPAQDAGTWAKDVAGQVIIDQKVSEPQSPTPTEDKKSESPPVT